MELDSYDGINAIYSFPCDEKLLYGGSLQVIDNAQPFESLPTDTAKLLYGGSVQVNDNEFEASLDMSNISSEVAGEQLDSFIEMLSNSNSSDKEKDIMQLSLDDIPLTEESRNASIFDMIPDNMPQDNLLLLQIPENMQNDDLLKEMLNVELDSSILENIHKTMTGYDGILLAPQSAQVQIQNDDGLVEFPIVRRQPLQVIQQIISYPVRKATKKVEKAKNVSRRKQHFELPREDLIEFYSDDENEDKNEAVVPIKSKPSKIDLQPPSPKKVKTEELTIKEKKVNAIGQKCPRCEKIFKRILLHKCKAVDPIELAKVHKKLRPSDVPLPLKCNICNKFVPDQEALGKHRLEMHSRHVCHSCKLPMKSANALKLHVLKCGVIIEAVGKENIKG